MKLLIFLSLFLISGCSVFVTKPEITLKSVKMVGLDSRDMELDFYFSVYNPNSFDLKLENYSYDVKIISLPLANGKAETSSIFYAKATTDLMIPVKIPYNNMLEIFKRNPNPEEIPYQIHTDLTIGGRIGSMAVPVTKSGTFAIPGELYPSYIRKKIGDFLKGLER